MIDDVVVREARLSVALAVVWPVGSFLEGAGERGFAHLVEHIRAEALSEDGFDIEMEAAGAESEISTARRDTALSIVAPRQAIDTLTSWLPRIVAPVPDRWDIAERERDVILEEIAQADDDPMDRPFRLLAAILFGDSSFGHPTAGVRGDLERATRPVMRQFTERVAAAVPAVVIAGTVEPSQFMERDLPSREPLRRGARFTSLPERRPTIGGANDACRTEPRESEMWYFALGLPSFEPSDPRSAAVELLSLCLGRTATSRLFQRLRQERSLVYLVSTFHDPSEGMFGVFFACRPELAAESARLIGSELADIARNGLRAEEIERALRLSTGRRQVADDDLRASAVSLARRRLGLAPATLWQDPSAIDRRANIREVARDLLRTKSFGAGCWGPSQAEAAATFEHFRDALGGERSADR